MPGKTPPRSPEEEKRRQEELDRALAPPYDELPPNRPRGVLGGYGFRVDEHEDWSKTDLNAGVSQEIDLPVMWVLVLLGYLFGFVPGFVILWLSKRFTRRQKIVYSVVGVVLAVAIVVALMHRR
jgi:hypothetical protein